MDYTSIFSTHLSEASLDLRAPEFARVRKGGWWLRLITLITVDFTFLLIGWGITEYYNISSMNYIWDTTSGYLPLLVTIFIQIAALAIQGNYQPGTKRCDYLNIIKTLTFAHGLIISVSFTYKPIMGLTRSTLLLSWLLSLSLICIARLCIEIILNYLRKQKILGLNHVFIIADQEEAEQIFNVIQRESYYTILGTADAQSLDRSYRQQTLENLNQLRITEVFISWNAIRNRLFICWLFQAFGITVHIIPMELKPIYRDIKSHRIGGMNCLSMYCPILTGKDFWIKRSLDFCCAAGFLLLFFPVYAVIAIAIKIDSPGAIFYQQVRIGLRGKAFKVWKFRTMRPDAEKLQKELEALNEVKDGIIFKIKDDPRITRVGKVLRRYSLDELPQLFNVLVGEMSLVGPRPLPIRDVEKFLERHFLRQEVLPGVTGLWQVSGRSDILDFEQVMKLDLNYIENWSIWLDFQILVKTVRVVLKKEGAY